MRETSPSRADRPLLPGRERRLGGLALAGALVVAALVIGQLQRDGDGERFGLVSQVPPVDAALAEASTGPEVGMLAPNFRLETLDGGSIRLSDLRGRPVVFAFWATGCASCVTEMSTLQGLADTYGDRLAVLGINSGEPGDQALAFATAQEIRYPLLLDPDRKVTQAYGVEVTPASFFIDADGLVRSVSDGPLAPDQVEEQLARLLAG